MACARRNMVAMRRMQCIPSRIGLRPYATSATSTKLNPHFDFKSLQKNVEYMHRNAINRLSDCNVKAVVNMYEEYCKTQTEIAALRHRRNQIANELKAPGDRQAKAPLIQEGANLKSTLAALEKRAEVEHEQLNREGAKVPNMTHPDVPVGDTPKLLRTFGQKPTFDFTPKTHEQLGVELGLIDFETASAVSGTKFYYLKNEAALLEIGLQNWAMQRLVRKGYTPITTPDLVKHKIAEGTGFQPRGDHAQKQIYAIENEDLCLIATAEISLAGLYADKIIPVKQLPVKMVGVSHCFRAEAGTAGKESRGLYRVHQFSKVEMFAIASPQQALELHEEILGIEEEIYKELGFHCKVLDMPTHDLGAPAYRKYDIEAWMPFKGDYGEITSTSNCTDYQSRRLNIRYQIEKGSNEYAHTLNGTALAVPRLLIALLEYGQQKDGSVVIPPTLRPFVGFDCIKPREKV